MDLDVSGLVYTIGGAAIGFGVSVLTNEMSRFRAAMDEAIERILNLNDVLNNSKTSILLGYLNHFSPVILKLAILDQKRAKRLIESIHNECVRNWAEAAKRIGDLPPNDQQITDFNGDRVEIVRQLCGFFHNNNRERWVTAVRKCSPDWHTLMLGALRGMGLHGDDEVKNKVV